MNINAQIASIFNNIGNMLEILGENPFKIRAYKNASQNVNLLDRDLSELAAEGSLTEIKGIGKDLAKKIIEFTETGRIEYYDELKSRVPEELLRIKSIQGIGPKLLQTLFSEFNVKNVADLEKTLADPEFVKLKGVGTKKINELKTGIKLFNLHLNKINLGIALPASEQLINKLLNIPGIDKAEVTGDLVRGKETVESIDLIISSKHNDKIYEQLKGIESIKKESINRDKTNIHFILNSGIPVNVITADKSSFNRLKFISTGNKEHTNCISKMYSDIGLDIKTQIFIDQQGIYKKLGLEYIPPELREGKEEIELAQKKKLPELVKLSDIKGDLHTHSTWSDGKSTIEEMVEAARKLGYEYIAITDHSVSSRIANGLDISRLKEKKKELFGIDESIDEIKIIFGSEVDIKPDGSLDYPDEILKELDMVVASVHSSFKMEEKEMTMRITKALSNPYVCALGHPTGRLIGERNPYNVDINAVIETACKYGKALEVNSSFMRLDLKDEHVKMAIDNGVKLIISTDAHHTDQLNQMRYGIFTSRRGRASKDNIINTLSQNKLIDWLNNFK